MKKAIILFNLGGPDKLDNVEPFLFNLFYDPAILNLPTFLRYPLAKLISNRRAPTAKNIYKELGGSSPILKLTSDQSNVIELAKTLDKVMNNNNVQMFIVFSRRTDEFIKDYLKKKYSKQNIVWEGKENPYLALMHYSKYLICTSDSVSIMSESVSAKKPVFIYKLPTSKRNNRIESFISTLVKKNYVKILSDRLEDHSNSYENETTEVAKTINERYSNQ